MPKPDNTPQDALQTEAGRLEDRLDAFEAKRAQGSGAAGYFGGAGDLGKGWRMVWEVASGFLGGAALGWAVDHFAHTAPWGVVIGLVVGGAVAVVLAARTAMRMGADSLAKNPVAPVADDDDD